MAGLHITLAGPTHRGPWQAVYIGEKASDAKAAVQAATQPWALLIHQPPAIRKRTPAAQADTAPEPVAEPPSVVEEPASDVPGPQRIGRRSRS